MALLGTSAVRSELGTMVVADNNAGVLQVTVFDVTGQTTLVATYTLVGSGVIGNPAMVVYPNGSIVLLYLTGTNTRNWRISSTPRPASSSDWVTP